ncbi:SAM-dependent methyltransferase [Sabulicella rubraurantiaca]|uniref:SAM-dependent methyltransferase n=1 Tax=Sabulicella rubraurantiaca TaxID=2811429 RepID=UPI001A972E64|nr:SAM-dependent methyltransferase [Sabulicella rubraurantiaca]
MIRAAYLADGGLEAPLEEELARRDVGIARWHGPLALTEAPPVPAAWALDIWDEPVELPAPSVKAAADALRGIQRNWSQVPVLHHRRSALIESRLPPVKARPLRFPEPAPTGHLGGWTLLSPDLLLASPTKSSPFPRGAVRFEEDREGPPSRAYLKLWEGLTRFGQWPGPGEVALDLGASPGGWSWALAQLGCEVVAVDKAPLDPRVAALPNVTLRQESAFGLAPEKVDWLFSDVICYPARLLGLVQRWQGFTRRMLCTVKFQGATDHETAEQFAALPGARLFHGTHNKHELTFLWEAP